LSAYLDGEEPQAAPVVAAPGETFETHLAACGACRGRLDQLAGARDLVRLPVAPVPSSVKAAAVATAMAEGLTIGTGRRSAPTAARRGSQWTRSTRLVAAVAAVALLAVTIGSALALSHGRSGTTMSAAATGAPAHTTTGANRAAAPLVATGAPALGSVGSVGALRSRLAPLLEAGHDNAAATAAPPSAAGTQSATAASPSGGFKAAVAVPTELATCVAAARRTVGPADPLALVATVTYGHTPALVVVVRGPGTTSTPEPPSLAVVVARSGCRVLARTQL
jgi:hypothetical protein